ncbi:(2Fe-2S)-binding protein [Mesorhizobium sp. M0659]|uniref:(2Fe-2S)-binding protein n=1 Tax=Mesorhizobium sp. M0659 TaxID=2956980 RepID=UPI0033358952
MSERMRIERNVHRPDPFDIAVNGQPVRCHQGEMLATALLAADIKVFRRMPSKAARMPVCNMGVCFECLVEVDGLGLVRSCLLPVERGMTMVLPP